MTKTTKSKGLRIYKKYFGEARLKKGETFEKLSSFDQLTVGHLFGTIWADKTLSLRERSLVTVAILASLGRIPELEKHLQGAIHIGITSKELEALMIHVSHYAGWPAGRSGTHALQEILQPPKKKP